MADIPAWTSLFLGLFSIAAAVGEMRRPGQWRKMLEEVLASPALLILTAFFEVAVGAVIYLANPWNLDDWLSSLMHALGGLMAIEGLAIVMFGERMSRLWLRVFAPWMNPLTWFSLILGVALVAVAILRF